MKSQFTGRLGVVLAVSMALAGCETMGELQNPFTDLMSF
jgi:hypothetical protein